MDDCEAWLREVFNRGDPESTNCIIDALWATFEQATNDAQTAAAHNFAPVPEPVEVIMIPPEHVEVVDMRPPLARLKSENGMPSKVQSVKKPKKLIFKSIKPDELKQASVCKENCMYSDVGKTKKLKKGRVCGTPFGREGLHCTKPLNHLGLCFGERIIPTIRA